MSSCCRRQSFCFILRAFESDLIVSKQEKKTCLPFTLVHPRRPRGSQSGREKERDESFQVRAKEPAFSPVLENFRRALSSDPTDCPWVSEDDSSLESPEAVFVYV